MKTLLNENKLSESKISSWESECAIIGYILLYTEDACQIFDMLESDEFYFKDNALIYSSIVSLYENHGDIGSITELTKSFTDGGEAVFIKNIQEYSSLGCEKEHLGAYISIIKRRKILRDLIDSTNDIQNKLNEREKNRSHGIELDLSFFQAMERYEKGRSLSREGWFDVGGSIICIEKAYERSDLKQFSVNDVRAKDWMTVDV